ncbi:unnamed protein product [Rodentolepis nana]|uniref:EF-hand domain-containing protein n=1 Tax=Rodentolepis nana TaxID=102285 RepID=A0A0R3TL45_RODNA|nr:unnamed protein product [Rodentolepis nana]
MNIGHCSNPLLTVKPAMNSLGMQGSAKSDLGKISDKVFKAFDLFDQDGNKTVNDRDIGTILRSLGLCPSEAELKDFISQIENNPPSGIINYERFFPAVRDIMLYGKFDILPEEEITRAFQALDPKKTGFVDQEVLKEHLLTEGESFTQEEMDEMLSCTTDPSKNKINYRDYAVKLADITRT